MAWDGVTPAMTFHSIHTAEVPGRVDVATSSTGPTAVKGEEGWRNCHGAMLIGRSFVAAGKQPTGELWVRHRRHRHRPGELLAVSSPGI